MCGEILMVSARVVDERPAFTWIYRDRIQLQIDMEGVEEKASKKKLRRGHLYELAIANLAGSNKESELMSEIKQNAIKELFSRIPDLLKIFGI